MTTQEVTTDINSLELQPIPIASQDTETHCLDVIRKHFKNILTTVVDRIKNRIKSYFNYGDTTDTTQPDDNSLGTDIASDLEDQLLTITLTLNKSVYLNQPVQVHKSVATHVSAATGTVTT